MTTATAGGTSSYILLAVAIVGHVARGRDTETKSEAALDSGPSSGWRIEQILKRTARSETCGVSRRGGPILVVLGGVARAIKYSK